MKHNISKEEAIKIFSNTNKTKKLLDKTLSNTNYEYFLKSEEKGTYSIFNGINKESICTTNDTLKCFIGLLYFEFGVGKDSIPDWAMYNGFSMQNWENINSQLPPSNDFKNLNSALDNGSILYCSNLAQRSINNFVITNPYNENYASKIGINEQSFSNGLSEINSIASLFTSDFQQEQ